MKHTEAKAYKKNNFVVYLLLLLSFFILLFFTKNIYSDIQVQSDTKLLKQTELQKKQATLQKLNDLQTKLKDSGSEALDEIQWFTGAFNDEDIVEYIYSYAQKINLTNDRLVIRDLSISEAWMSDIWFNEGNVQVSAVFSSEDTLLNFISFLTSKWEKYRFYIDTFEYNMNESSGNIQASIPLILYYQK